MASGSRIDWNELMEFKRSFTEPVPEKREDGLIKAGIQTFHGRAKFIGEDQIQVGDDILKGKYILIATGAKPVPLPIEGIEHLTYSDEFLELDELPQKIIFIGGGFYPLNLLISLRELTLKFILFIAVNAHSNILIQTWLNY